MAFLLWGDLAYNFVPLLGLLVSFVCVGGLPDIFILVRIMAEAVEALQTDYFNIGSTVSCRTCHNDDMIGEVVAFDPQTKMLILRSPASTANSYNFNIVNLQYVSDLKVNREPTEPVPPPENLSTTRLSRRLQNNVDNKRLQIEALREGVSVDGQALFLTISKTIPHVAWSGNDILVMNEVRISSPYTVDKVAAVCDTGDSKALPHVRKVVDKFFRDRLE